MRKLLIFLFVLLVVIVGVDIGGRAFAESKAGEAIAVKTGTSAPSVSIHGFSFLVQAIPGHYQNITLTSSDVAAGPITGISATIELYNVNFPISDAVKGDTTHLTAATATINGVIPDAALSQAIPQAGTTVSAGPGGAIRLSTTVKVGGQSVPVTADLMASYSFGVLHLTAQDVTAAGISVPAAIIAQLTKNLSLSLPLKELPFTVDAATVTSSGTNLILTATATDVRIGSTA